MKDPLKFLYNSFLHNYIHAGLAKKAHVAFLNPVKGEPILLIEDMKLNSIVSLSKVIVAPLLIENADGAPCTIFGYSSNED